MKEKSLREFDPEIYRCVQAETARQNNQLELIASENFAFPAVLEALGSTLNNKYAEGYPKKRYYGGCHEVDIAETLACQRAKKLFNVEWVNVQPHSGAQANAVVYLALLKPGDSFLSLDLAHGGHLTHGSKVNFSGKIYNPHFYGVNSHTGYIDLDQVRDKAKKIRPKLISIGASSYSRDLDYPSFRAIADEVGASLWLDMAHTAGLIATKELSNPFAYCDIITTTTHKTLRGPRGGMLLIGKDRDNTLGIKAPKSGRIKKWSELYDSALFPGIQGGPHMHTIAAKAVAFYYALQPEFKIYQKQVKRNAKEMEKTFLQLGYNIISGGTDNHLLLIDLRNKKITGKDAETILEKVGITVNKNMIPFDPQSPFITSGIRIGTPAITTRGIDETCCKEIILWMDKILSNPTPANLERVRKNVKEMSSNYPLFYKA